MLGTLCIKLIKTLYSFFLKPDQRLLLLSKMAIEKTVSAIKNLKKNHSSLSSNMNKSLDQTNKPLIKL